MKDKLTVTEDNLLKPGVKVAEVSTASCHPEDHDAQQEQDRGTA